jgi:DNA adenine methylase
LASTTGGGWEPPRGCSEEEYKKVKFDTKDKALHGYIGIGSSYSGKWWGGYARGKKENGEWRDYTLNCYNQCMKRRSNLQKATFICSGYSKMLAKAMKVKKPMVIYLDPPYQGTTQFVSLPLIDYDLFWQNVRVVSKKHYVITSSYEAPEDFKVIREFNPKTGMNIGRNEKIFAEGLILEDYNCD